MYESMFIPHIMAWQAQAALHMKNPKVRETLTFVFLALAVLSIFAIPYVYPSAYATAIFFVVACCFASEPKS